MTMNKLWREAWQLVREHGRLLSLVNLAFFGVVGLGMVVTAKEPAFEAWFWAGASASRQWGIVQWALATWWGKSFALTVAAIFFINLIIGSLLYLTLPSLVIPGAALPLVLFRAAVWGIISLGLLTSGDVPSIPLVFLEGEAYVLATTGALVHARAWLFPQRVGAPNYRAGYRLGLGQNLAFQLLVSLELSIAALYETLLIFFDPARAATSG